jgi:hypothetical protein
MTIYDCTLLVDVAPSDEFLAALEEAGLYDRLDLSGRPGEAGLGLRDGRPAFGGPGLSALAGLLSGDRKVLAFSHAAEDDLAGIDGTALSVKSLHVRVRRAGPGAGPYHRRLVVLERARVEAPQSMNQSTPQAQAQADGLPRLSLAPISLALTHEEVVKLIEALSPGGPVLLPPTRQQMPRGSYLAPERLAIRRRWAKDGPALFRLWQCETDALVRDLIADGGALALRIEAGQPTAACLRIWQGEDAVAAYRACFFLEPDTTSGVAQALLADVAGLSPGGLAVERADAAVERGALVGAEPPDPGAPSDGTAQRIAALGAALGRRDSALFATLVPATPDHDLAERRFLAAFAHPGAIEPAGWRHAWFPSGLAILGGAEQPAIPELVFEQGGPDLVAIHPPRASAADLTRWALLLPLRSVLAPDTAVRLDDENTLPAGDDWAGGVQISRSRPHPRQKLTATAARDQEAYVLARAGFRSGRVGLEELTVGESVRVVHNRRVRAERLSGLTPDGRPVLLRDGDALTAPLLGTAAECHFEAFVEVDPPDAECRYRLAVVPQGETAEGLDLGGYHWRQGQSVRLTRRPAYQTFAAIAPWDEAHAAPLVSRLAELQALEQGNWPSALPQRAFAPALMNVADNWPQMPLDELARALEHLGWLLGYQPGAGPRRSPAPPSKWAARPVAEWPAALAALTVPLAAALSADSPLIAGHDYSATPVASGTLFRFLRERGVGQLRFRFPPSPESRVLALTGKEIRSSVALNGAGGELLTNVVTVSEGVEATLSPAPSSPPLVFFHEVRK